MSAGMSTAVSAAVDVRWRAAPTIPAGGGVWRPSPVAVEAQVWRAESAVLGASPDPYATTEAPSTAPGQPVLLPPAVESAWAVAALAAAAEEAAAQEAAAEAAAEAEAAATSLVHRPVSSVHRPVSSVSSKRFAPPEDAPDTALDSELSLSELMASAITSLPMRSPRAQHGAAYEAAAHDAALATALAAAAEHPAFAWSSGAVPGGGGMGSVAMEGAAGIGSAVVSAGGAGGGYDCGGGGCSGAAEQEPNYDDAQHGAYMHNIAQHGATLQEPNYGAEAGFDAVGMHWGVPNTALPRAETPSDEIGAGECETVAGECGRVRASASEPPSVSVGRRDWLRRKVRRAVWEAVEPYDCH